LERLQAEEKKDKGEEDEEESRMRAVQR